jgi:hypothetical protein
MVYKYKKCKLIVLELLSEKIKNGIKVSKHFLIFIIIKQFLLFSIV